jgi:hypothetical protein
MIGILTFHWADDYGAMLQAYALKTYIKGLDRGEVEVLPYAPVKLAGRYWLFPVTGIEMNRKIVYFFGAWGFVKNVSHMYAYLKRRKSMRNFRQRYLTSKAEVRKAGRLSLKVFLCFCRKRSGMESGYNRWVGSCIYGKHKRKGQL